MKPYTLKKEQFKQINIKISLDQLKKLETVLKGIEKLEKPTNFSRNTLMYYIIQSAIENNIPLVSYGSKDYTFNDLLDLGKSN